MKERKVYFWVYALTLIGFCVVFTLGCNGDGDIEPVDIEIGTVEDIDGNIYKTLLLGDQVWMAENLRTTRYADGSAINTDLSNTEWRNTEEGAYAVYPPDNVEGIVSQAGMAEAYGKLYNWYAVADARGLCPEGWKVPEDDDWDKLENYLIKAYDLINYQKAADGLGNALKSCRQVASPLGDDCSTELHPRWYPDETHFGTDEFGFAGLPAGDRGNFGNFYYIGGWGWWWTSTTAAYHEHELVYYRNLQTHRGDLIKQTTAKTFGYSVRCIKK